MKLVDWAQMFVLVHIIKNMINWKTTGKTFQL